LLRVTSSELNQTNSHKDIAARSDDSRVVTLRDAEREHIIQALAETNWIIGGIKGAAARLGLKRTTLASKMRRMGISRAMA